MRDVDRPLMVLYILVTKNLRFRSWMETEPSFFKNSLNYHCLSLYIVLKHLFKTDLVSYYFTTVTDQS